MTIEEERSPEGQKLIEDMVSCYDNGSAMIEHLEEYINSFHTCENCKKCEIIKRKFANTYHCTAVLKYRDLQKDFGCNRWEYKSKSKVYTMDEEAIKYQFKRFGVKNVH